MFFLEVWCDFGTHGVSTSWRFTAGTWRSPNLERTFIFNTSIFGFHIYIYIYVYAYIHLRICVKIYLYINNGGSKSPPQLWGGMCGNSDLYTAETVPFPSLKPTGSPLKTGRDPKESSSNHPFSGVTPTRLKAFLMNTRAENELHFSNWNFKKKIWRQHNFCWMIWNIWSICKMLSRILILSRANNKSWFMSGQRCWLPWVPLFFSNKACMGWWSGGRSQAMFRTPKFTHWTILNPLKSPKCEDGWKTGSSKEYVTRVKGGYYVWVSWWFMSNC